MKAAAKKKKKIATVSKNPAGTKNGKMLVRKKQQLQKKRKKESTAPVPLPRRHTQYKYVRCHQKNCQGGYFSIIVFIWRAFCCPKAKRRTHSPRASPTPSSRGLAVQQTGEKETEWGGRKSLRLKADLTLGSVTTDQNPLKAIDHFHYSSHVPHLETVYQTQRVCLRKVHTHTHTRTEKDSTTKDQNNTAFDLSQLHLNIYTGWVAHLQTNVYCTGKTALNPVQWNTDTPALPTSETTGGKNIRRNLLEVDR